MNPFIREAAYEKNLAQFYLSHMLVQYQFLWALLSWYPHFSAEDYEQKITISDLWTPDEHFFRNKVDE